jgi:acyl phosphate:glycerol-3-phosphate acyltransferase
VYGTVFILVALGGYCLGSIPTGYCVGRLRGVDIRLLGSGNIGATNVMRILGKPIGIFVLLVDALKGYLACMLLPSLAIDLLAAGTDLPDKEWLRLAGGIMAILGHNFPCWLRFKGGKGIATSAGVLAALMPWAFAICVGTWLATLGVSRYVSVASIAAAIVLPPAVWATQSSRLLLGVSVMLSAMAVFKHRTNIQRLLDGTEHRLGQKSNHTTQAN